MKKTSGTKSFVFHTKIFSFLDHSKGTFPKALSRESISTSPSKNEHPTIDFQQQGGIIELDW